MNQRNASEVVRGDWRSGLSGLGVMDLGRHSCVISAPVEIGGGIGESPSTLLLAGASGCFLLTLVGLLERRGISMLRISIESQCVYSGGAPPDLHMIVHRPTVYIDEHHMSRLAAIRRCFDLAKDACVASRALAGVVIAVEGATCVDRGDARERQTARDAATT
jgi:peroxiredoxin-like protein